MPKIPEQPYQKPLEIPKDRVSVKATRTVTLDDSTAITPPQALLTGGFGGALGSTNNEGASPFLTRFLPPKKPEYSTREIYRAAFERENTIGSAVADTMNGTNFSNANDPNFNSAVYIHDNIAGTKYEPYYEKFIGLNNEDDATKLKQKLDKEEYNSEVMSSSGFSGLMAGFAASIVDPINFIPIGGGAYKSFKVGKFARGIGETALAGAGGMALSEAVLQSQQETRTTEESAINIASGAVLGGILGGAGALLSKRKFNAIAKNLEKDLAAEESSIKINPETQKAEDNSVGAAAVRDSHEVRRFYNETYIKEEVAAGRTPLSFEEFSIKAEGLAPVLGGESATKLKNILSQIPVLGKITDTTAKALGKIDRINPALRILNNTYSPVAKEVFQKLSTTGMWTFKNELGIANNQSVQIARKQLVADFENVGIPESQKLFKDYVKRVKAEGGEVKSRIDFEKEIVRAMNYGDVSQIPEVTSIAKIFRKTNLDPLSAQGAEQGILRLKTFNNGRSYFPQNWNIQAVVAKEKELRELLVSKIQTVIIPQIKNAFNKTERNLISEISELGARRDELQSILDKVKQATKPSNDDLLLLEQWKANNKTLKDKPKSLIQFIKENGGIHDTNGELRALGITYKTKVGLIRKDLNGDTSMDSVTRRAWEAGYFPEHSNRPDIKTLLDAMDEDMRGNYVYSEKDLERIMRREYANAFFDDLNSRGIFDDDVKLLKTKIKETGETINKLLITKEKELIQKKIDRLDNRMKDNRVAFDARFEYVGDQKSYVDEVVDNILANLKKERYGNSIGDFVVAERGPMKRRALDFLEYDEIAPYLNNDATEVLKNYARIMSTDIELAKAFDGDLKLESALDDIAEDYNKATLKATTSEERLKINKEKKEVIRDIEATRDILRGNYGQPDDPDSIITRTFQAGRKLNYMSKMGMVTISSMADMANPVAIHGFKRWLPAIGNLITNLQGVKLNVEEAKLAGNINEKVSLGRLATMAEIGDPFSSNRSSFERLLNNGVKLQSRLNLMPLWNDAHKSFSSVISQQRIIKESQKLIDGTIEQGDRAYLAFLGIGAPEAKAISDQISKFGYKKQGLFVANTKDWVNQDIMRIYRNALNTDIDRTIVTLGAGDVPLWMKTETGKAIGQFKSFAFACTQQVLIARLQQKDTAALSGLISAVTLGMFSYYLSSVIKGKKLSDDPRKWVVEGLDKSGYLGILMEGNNIIEKASGGKFGLNALTDGETMTRYVSRNITSSFLGPTVGLVEDAAKITSSISKGEIKKRDIRAIRNILPAQNVFYLRTAIDEMEEALNSILGTK